MSIEPTLAQLVRVALESRIADVHVSIPGIVESYDAGAQVATVVPAVRRVIFTDEQDQVAEDFPALQNVPVIWPGGGGMYLHFPLTEGDTGHLVFSERSFSEWRTTGLVSTPGDLRMHALQPVFYPGLRSDKEPREDAPADGEGVISVGDGVLRVGPSAGSQFTALANLVDARFAQIHDALAGVTPAPPAPPDAGEPGLLALKAALSAPFASVACTKLRTK